MKRRNFAKNIALASGAFTLAGTSICCNTENKNSKKILKTENEEAISPALSLEMYDKALQITKSKIRGGETEPYFKKPFIDAAFSPNLFLWDTCFMCCFAKYHLDELPVYQALNNFYEQMEPDGYICREYRQDGSPLWDKNHPVSINPPLLAWAEWEIYNVSKDLARLKYAYPFLKKHFQFLVNTYQMEDGLFYGDTLGMGMDNIPRSPKDWVPTEGNGMTHHELGDKLAKMNASGETKLNLFIKEYVLTKQGVWNKQGRLVDFSSQMAMFAQQLIEISKVLNIEDDLLLYNKVHQEIYTAINEKCWNEEDGYYYDLGFNKQVPRMHIGAYWTLLGKLVPEKRLDQFLEHLTNPNEFYRLTPLPALSASDPDYVGWGDYWLGGVWAPTSYMVLRGLSAYNKEDLAKDLAKKIYKNVATVYQATGTFWENYAPDLIAYGMPAKKDFCGWTALIPISFYNEYIKD